MTTSILVENLSKRYRIGMRAERSNTLLGEVANLARSPVRNLRNLRRLTSFRNDLQDTEDTIWALRDISFTVQEGEVIGVVGPNGAGKSTLLKVLSRITPPTSGRARIRGRVSSLLEVGTGFHPELTGRENTYLNGTILGMRKKEIDRKFSDIVEFAGVEKFIDTPVKRYSSGMKVRLAFAVAAHLEPEILIIDEVLAVGDLAFQRKCLGKMDQISKGQNRTVLFVSHNMAAISAVCARSILLQDGHLVCDGDTTQVIMQYRATLDEAQQSHVDLTNWPTRRGEGERAQFTSATLRTLDGEPAQTIPMGAGLQVSLGITFEQDMHAVDVGLAFTNMLGHRLSHLVSSWEDLDQPVKAGTYCYDITIPHIPFVPGMYSIIIWVKQQNGPTADRIEDALGFEITSAPIHTGHIPKFDTYCQPGETFMPSQWTMRSE